MTTTDLMLEADCEPLTEPGGTPLDDWRPLTLDPVRQRLVELGGARIAEVLSEASSVPLPPLSTSYGRFHRICGETDEALTIWFQPVGDVPAIRLTVLEPFVGGWALTEELVVPTAKRHLVVLAPLADREPAPGAHAQVVAICPTPIEDYGVGARLVAADVIPSGRLTVPGPLVDF